MMAMVEQELARKLRLIGIPEAVEALEMMARDPSFAALGFDERMRFLVDYVAQDKNDASVKRLLKRAHLRIPGADVAGIVYDGRPLSRDAVMSLASCKFRSNATDILVTGFTGTGKSYLACALAKQACKNQLSALYVRMPDMLREREESLSSGVSETKILRKYARFDVLAVDEWLIDEPNPDQIRFLLELVDRRYDRSSTIWCSQYPVADWHGILGGGTHADAILDRIVHNAVTLHTGEINMRELLSNNEDVA